MEERKGRPGSARQATVRGSSPPRPQRTDKRTPPPTVGDTHDRGLFDRLAVGLYRTSPAGQIIDVNPAFLGMSGYPDLEALAAINAADLYADPVTRMRLRAVLERDGVVDFESRLRRRDGSLLWVRAYLRGVRDASGKVECVEGALIDLTGSMQARTALAQSEERLELVARATNDLVWDWDLLTNEGWRGAGGETLFGYTGSLDRPWPEWWSENIHPEDRESVLASVRRAITDGGPAWSGEYRFRRANGEYAHVRDRGYIVRDATHRAVRMVGAMTDLTDRSAAEEEIRRRAMHLEALNAIIAGAVAAVDLRALLEETVDRTMKALDAQMGGIWVGDLHVDRGVPPEVALIFTRARAAAGPDLQGSVIASDWQDASSPMADVLAPLQARFGIWASLTAPLEKDGRVVGGLAVASPQFRTWLPEETTLVAAVGKQVGAAAERLQLFGDAQQRARLMGQLVALSDVLNRSLTVAEVTSAIGEGALSLSGADRAGVFLSQEEGVVTCPWSRGLSSGYVAEVLAHYADLPVARFLEKGIELTQVTLPGGRVVEGRKPFLYPDMGALPPTSMISTLAKSEGYRALGLWPLTYERRVIGVVACYYNAPRTWSGADEEAYLMFCLQAVVALQNARLHDAQAQRTAQLEAFYGHVLDVLSPADGGKP